MGRHCLVIGASSGIGFATASRWLGRGDTVSVIARRSDRLAPLADQGGFPYPADATDLESLESAIKVAVDTSGLIDVMVYCAGMQVIKPARMIKAPELQAMIATNLTAPLMVAGMFGSKKIASPNAVLCLVSSIAGSRPEPGITAYAATKAAVDNAVRGLARELGPRRVVGIAPGWLDTEMTQAQSRLYDDAFRERLAKDSPAGPASVEDVVNAIDFLSSDNARAITGEILRVDGGAAA